MDVPRPAFDPVGAADLNRPLSEHLKLVHQRIRRQEPSIERLDFLLHQPVQGQLIPYLSSGQRLSAGAPDRFAHELAVAELPWLPELVRCRQGLRVATDTFALPLLWGQQLQGLLLLRRGDGLELVPDLQDRLACQLELLGSLVAHELSTINSLRSAVRMALQFSGLQDLETVAHMERVSLYSRLIADGLGRSMALPQDFGLDLYVFAGLHDIGKVAIPQEILRKPGSLDAGEQEIARTHVDQGLRLVEQLVGGFQLVGEGKLQILRNVVACHHERMDGSGYPLGLRGEQIPLEARIVAVADIYDALIQRRHYKQPIGEEEVLAILAVMVEQGSLDRRCVEVLQQAKEQRRCIRLHWPE
ncbi:HD-GYP domain-containing protein [Vulcanococcus limneticus]|uniref:HD-GYP domain-containing protein n=1 Tax=Vulcanococcus limneticus TaxID=2170428 RepID=UPI00398BE568